MSLPARVLLGVSAGIAAYKSVELCRRLRERGCEVRVVLTDGARHFVGAASFHAVTGQPVRSSLWDEAAEAAMGHIELARWAELILVAPATADLMARLAHGLADDLLTTLCLASEAPLVLVPAMNRVMWAHPATRANVKLLSGRGVRLLGPGEGDQACGDVGPGRMLDVADIVAMLDAPQPLSGLRILVSAGPTYEDIDPVRFVGNRSSGRMGFALAEAAVAMGATTTLVAGPVALATPPGVRRIDVRSARDMLDAVLVETPGHDIFISAAAVADYAPQSVSAHKIKKGSERMTLELAANPDVLATVAALPAKPFLVGFAAETENVREHALGKLERKKLDMIAANQVGGEGTGFDCADNALLVLWPGGETEIGRADKLSVARQLLLEVAARHRQARGT
ncbi:MAG TPA: bifunctional phosphopantothenoylcysteine decarboxylase/phosphopantothenate--cysteine ligase CoaBC [Xanthomonadaceae bacterium]|nr:bifunctional phosphopantothenoylcysteine decarboxylase/phosphopantothenate--cysteine ligase CoaBC [Xanthomonadaceae bacterium]